MVEFFAATIFLGAFGGLARLGFVTRKPGAKVTFGQFIRHCYLGAFAATLVIAVNRFTDGVYFDIFLGLISGAAYMQAINGSLTHAGYSRELYVALGTELPDE